MEDFDKLSKLSVTSCSQYGDSEPVIPPPYNSDTKIFIHQYDVTPHSRIQLAFIVTFLFIIINLYVYQKNPVITVSLVDHFGSIQVNKTINIIISLHRNGCIRISKLIREIL